MDADFEKIDIPFLGPQCAYRYFPEDATYSDVFREMTSINYSNFAAVFEKIAILYGGLSVWPLFLELQCSYSPATDSRWINS
jgi:hypothetical protein